ncbi:helix-turn-helix domain-containing protein [[Eubacterium] hominis]|uniref:helix-turn-helix transcriptional regulator n=1 Tax=[Eubacterium] hominis TaxID=2764325 RepID=UPI0022DECB5B
MIRPTFTLKACRINRNLTIKQVADRVGRSQRTVINWEKYETTPNSIDLRILSEIYGVSEDLIFLGDKSTLSGHYQVEKKERE